MKEDKLKAFNQWYAQNYEKGFSLREQLPIYCKLDVEILQQALVKIRSLIIEITSRGKIKQLDVNTGEYITVAATMDVLPRSMTIASVCMNIYKRMFVKPNEIPIVPERG
jgi:hypothetical protein